MDVAANLGVVRAHLEAACRAAGREVSTVTLVAVSKGQPAEAIRAAHAAGQRDFGENYAQELRDKAQQLADLPDLRWHFLGALQTNKVKYVAPVTTLFHALDRLEVAAELQRRLLGLGRTMDVLLEVNVAGEAQKHGISPTEAAALADQVRAFTQLRLRGLMCVPPAVDEAEASRPHFRALRELGGRLGLNELSMGMSGDYEVAVQEGATLVRVGTAIFGPRQKPA
ncbi:MAG: YggS family pyridoxal phosphate-dependent enzyme [Myxococcota bacterium]